MRAVQLGQSRIVRLTIASLLICCICHTQAQTDVASTTTRTTFVVGKVSDNPRKHYQFLKPMADYLADQLRDLGYTEGKVLMAKNNRQMVRYLTQGKVDLVTETAFSAVVFQKKADAKLLLRKWKKGVPEYHTVIFARRDSGIESLQDLKGKKIAFEDRGSTTAFYVPASVLLRNRLQLEELDSLRSNPIAGKVSFVFSGEEINTSIWVHKGLVDAGAFNNLDWEKDDHMPKRFHQDLQIIHKTKSFPRAIELVRRDLPSTVIARLKLILLSMHKTEEGQRVLRAYQRTKKFDEINDEMWQQLKEVRQVVDIVDREIK